MVKFNRRYLLRTGLAAGALATATQATQVSAQQKQSEQSDLTSNGDQPILVAQAAGGYDRQISDILVRCCGLAVEQYLYSQKDSSYDGSIQALAGYSAEFGRYKQVASFRAAQLSLSEQESPLLNQPVVAAKSAEVAISVSEVFFGYALTSDTHNIIALRGTLTENEWLGNITARQVNFRNREPQYGKVHQGFQTTYEKIITQIRRTLPQLNLALPCYITGHSLGGAVAILTAATLAFDNSVSRNQIRVYTYASPRVGDPTFAQFYQGILPNTFRVVNLADTVPISPPSSFRGDTFVHAGQEWSFLAQLGSINDNHAIETYRIAVNKGVVINQTRSYPISAACT